LEALTNGEEFAKRNAQAMITHNHHILTNQLKPIPNHSLENVLSSNSVDPSQVLVVSSHNIPMASTVLYPHVNIHSNTSMDSSIPSNIIVSSYPTIPASPATYRNNHQVEQQMSQQVSSMSPQQVPLQSVQHHHHHHQQHQHSMTLERSVEFENHHQAQSPHQHQQQTSPQNRQSAYTSQNIYETQRYIISADHALLTLTPSDRSNSTESNMYSSHTNHHDMAAAIVATAVVDHTQNSSHPAIEQHQSMQNHQHSMNEMQQHHPQSSNSMHSIGRMPVLTSPSDIMHSSTALDVSSVLHQSRCSSIDQMSAISTISNDIGSISTGMNTTNTASVNHNSNHAYSNSLLSSPHLSYHQTHLFSSAMELQSNPLSISMSNESSVRPNSASYSPFSTNSSMNGLRAGSPPSLNIPPQHYGMNSSFEAPDALSSSMFHIENDSRIHQNSNLQIRMDSIVTSSVNRGIQGVSADSSSAMSMRDHMAMPLDY
jgi:hypothetical protein